MLPIRVRLRESPESYGYIVGFTTGFDFQRVGVAMAAIVCWDGGQIVAVNIADLEHMGIREEPHP